MQDEILICKCDPTRYYDDEDLFEVKSPISQLQTYSGIYDFDVVMRIIDGYKPIRILVYSANMHGSTIVKIISAITRSEYKLTITRSVLRNDRTEIRIILRFYTE